MIFRLSQKLAKKLKIPLPKPAPGDSNPLADWSAHLFTADRTQYVILTNTPSLYSTVIYGRGITDNRQFLDRALGAFREFMVADGHEFIYRRLVAPASASIRFASALNRSVIGSMNDLIFQAKMLSSDELSPFDVSLMLNESPMSSFDYRDPREAFKLLGAERLGLENNGT